MKSFSKLLLVLAIVMATTSVVTVAFGATSYKKDISKGFTIGFSQMENNMPWRIAETESIKAISEKHPEVKVIITDAQGSVAKQVSDIEDLLARGVDFLVIAPREYEGFEPAFEAAKRAGVPVMLVDREARGVPGEDFVTVATADFWNEGRLCALFLVAKMGGKGNIIELQGTAGSSVARDRGDGFRAVIKWYPDMKIIASQTADFTRMDALKVMENLIQQFGEEIDAVYAHNDEMALGAIGALKASGLMDKKKIWVASIDGQKSALKAIMDGDLDISVECPPFFGDVVYETAVKVLSGEKVPTHIPVKNVRIFTKENAHLYYDPDSIF